MTRVPKICEIFWQHERYLRPTFRIFRQKNPQTVWILQTWRDCANGLNGRLIPNSLARNRVNGGGIRSCIRVIRIYLCRSRHALIHALLKKSSIHKIRHCLTYTMHTYKVPRYTVPCTRLATFGVPRNIIGSQLLSMHDASCVLGQKEGSMQDKLWKHLLRCCAELQPCATWKSMFFSSLSNVNTQVPTWPKHWMCATWAWRATVSGNCLHK